MKTAKTILAIVGPTASGKTAVSLDLARRLNGEIISADSRQVYRFMDIGTAKPTAEERAGIPHHFIDILNPDESYSAGMYGIQGRIVIDEIFSRGRLPIVVGGSGLYIRSLIDGLFEGPGANVDFRDYMNHRLEREGLGVLVEELRRVDPASAERIDPTKPRRIIRALEVFHLTGRPMSEQHEEKPSINFQTVQVGLLWERGELYDRINRRCEEMMERGLLDEVDALAARGYDRRLQALNTVGYAEGFAHRAGEMDRDEMMTKFKQNSRRYAKRQGTWFNADARIHWMAMMPACEVAVAEAIAKQWNAQGRQ